MNYKLREDTALIMRRMASVGATVNFAAWAQNTPEGVSARETFYVFCNVATSRNFRFEFGIDEHWQILSEHARRVIGDVYLFTQPSDEIRPEVAVAKLAELGEHWDPIDLNNLVHGLFSTMSPARRALQLAKEIKRYMRSES